MDETPRSHLRRRPAAVSGGGLLLASGGPGGAGAAGGGSGDGDGSNGGNDSGGAFSPALLEGGGPGGGGFAAARHKIMTAAAGGGVKAPSGPAAYGTGTRSNGATGQQHQQGRDRRVDSEEEDTTLRLEEQEERIGDTGDSGSPSASARSRQQGQGQGQGQQGQGQGQGQQGQGQGRAGGDGGRQLPPDFFLDEEAEAARHPFPLPPAELIARTRRVLAAGVADWPHLAHDFEFSAPFIGPLGRDAFRRTMATLELEGAFPDLAPRYHHFRVDPFRPNRVWFTLQPRCTHTGTFRGKLPFGIAPTGRQITEPPQTASLAFNTAGQVCGYTMGYVMDRRVGNTGGLGGAFGLMWALRSPLPAPEGRPWSPSLQLRLLNSGVWLLQAAVYLYDRVTAALLPAAWLTRHSRNTM